VLGVDLKKQDSQNKQEKNCHTFINEKKMFLTFLLRNEYEKVFSMARHYTPDVSIAFTSAEQECGTTRCHQQCAWGYWRLSGMVSLTCRVYDNLQAGCVLKELCARGVKGSW
jgi:hypothetical protein